MHKITQPTPNSCASTCLAMLLEVDVFELIKDFHNSYLLNHTKPSGYMSDFMKVERCHGEDDIEHGYIYVIVVPTIFPEVPGTTHVVIADNRSGTLEILDPGEGRGPFYYSADYVIKSLHAFKFHAGFTPLFRVSAADYAEYLEYRNTWETQRDEEKDRTIGRFSADLMEDLRIHVAEQEKRAYIRKQREQEDMHAVMAVGATGTKGEVILVDSEELSWVGEGLAGMFPGTKSGRG